MRMRHITQTVESLEKEIVKTIERLNVKSPTTPRIQRQIGEAKEFLNLLKENPYIHAKNVGNLTAIIRKKREEWKNVVEQLQSLLPPKQYTMFDEDSKKDMPKERIEAIEYNIQLVNLEIKKLHRALGICINQTYFD